MVGWGIAKYALIGVGIMFLALFFKRSAETSIGQASTEIASSIGVFGSSLGAIGSGLGTLGTGFSSFLRSTLDPFGLLGQLGGYLAPKAPNPTATSGQQNDIVSISTPAGTVGGFNPAQSTAESINRAGFTATATIGQPYHWRNA